MTTEEQIEYLKERIEAGPRTPEIPHIKPDGTAQIVLCFDEIQGSPEMFKKSVDLLIREMDSIGLKATNVIGNETPAFMVFNKEGKEEMLDNSRGNKAVILMERIQS